MIGRAILPHVVGRRKREIFLDAWNALLSLGPIHYLSTLLGLLYQRRRVLSRVALILTLLAYFVFSKGATSVEQKKQKRTTIHTRHAPEVPSPVTLLSTDFHIGPIGDLKDLALKHSNELKTNVIDLSLSQACTHVKTCATPSLLKVLRQGDTGHSLYFNRETRMQFFDEYRKEESAAGEEQVGDGLLSKVDAVICSHPTGMCELYMPFNLSIILWATTRFEQGRESDASRLKGLVKNVRAIASKPWNVVAANNAYDVAYIQYYTGITPMLIPSYCDYPNARYAWESSSKTGGAGATSTIPVFGYRPGFQPMSLQDFLIPANKEAEKAGVPFRFENIHSVYTRRYGYDELASSHPAVLHIPYQVSVMSFYEQYRMGIPIIAPGIDLLTRWHLQYLMVSERGWGMRRPGKSLIPRHPTASDKKEQNALHPLHFDPYDDLSYSAVRHWLSYGDYFTYPHVILFNSWEELAEKLATTDLKEVSRRMHEYSAYLEEVILQRWTEVLSRVAEGKGGYNKLLTAIRAEEQEDDVEVDYSRRMDAIYGAKEWVAY